MENYSLGMLLLGHMGPREAVAWGGPAGGTKFTRPPIRCSERYLGPRGRPPYELGGYQRSGPPQWRGNGIYAMFAWGHCYASKCRCKEGDGYAGLLLGHKRVDYTGSAGAAEGLGMYSRAAEKILDLQRCEGREHDTKK